MASLRASAPLRLARCGAPALRVARRGAVRAPAASPRPFPGAAVGARGRGFAPRASGASPPEPPSEPPGGEKAKEGKAKPGELLTKQVVARAYDKEQARKVLDQLKKLGADNPATLQKLFVRRGLTRLYPRAISAILNFSAAWVAFLAFALSRQSEDLGYFQRFIESVCFTVGLNYGLGFVSELFVFFSVAAASILYGANVDAFLAAVSDAAGVAEGAPARLGLSSVDAALEAASAVKVVEALSAIRELLRAQTAGEAAAAAPAAGDNAADARTTFLNLAALLAVANGASTKKFDASEWSLTEAEAVRIARVFARYDGLDSRLDAQQLRRLTTELGQPLSDAETRVAMSMLDEDGNGVIDLSEFVAWWAGTRRVPPPKPATKPADDSGTRSG